MRSHPQHLKSDRPIPVTHLYKKAVHNLLSIVSGLTAVYLYLEVVVFCQFVGESQLGMQTPFRRASLTPRSLSCSLQQMSDRYLPHEEGYC